MSPAAKAEAPAQPEQLMSTAELRQALPLATVRGLEVCYDPKKPVPVLDGVDLDLFPGEMVSLLGASAPANPR